MQTTTCIVAVKTKRNGIWIGGDSAGVDGRSFSHLEMRAAKVFRNGKVLIGYTSSFRMGQLLQYKLTVPTRKTDQDRDHFMVHDFTEAVRTCLKDGGFAKITDERHSGGTFIVVYDDMIYKIQDDYACLMMADPFVATGCGEEYALGALYAAHRRALSKEALLVGLQAASRFSAGVRAPFYLIHDRESWATRKYDRDGLEILSERRSNP